MMHIRVDSAGRIVARRNSPPPEGAPGTWHEVADDTMASPEMDGPGTATAYWRDGQVEWEVEHHPDVDGVLDTLADELPRAVARTVLDGYVVSALQRGRYERVWEALADSHEAGDLTDDQWDTIVQTAEEHNLPGPTD